MHFDCRFSNAQVTGNLFIQLAGDDMFEHFPLARCEGVETRADFGKPGLFSTGDSISFDGCANGRKEIFLLHWFREEIERAMFHRLHTLRNVAVTGEKNNRQRTAFLSERCLKLKAVDVGHGEIKHETSRHVWIVLGKKFTGRRKTGHGNAGRTQQTRDSFSYRCVIVDDKHCGAGGRKHYGAFINVVATGLWPVHLGHVFTVVRRPTGPWLQRSSSMTKTVGLVGGSIAYSVI